MTHTLRATSLSTKPKFYDSVSLSAQEAIHCLSTTRNVSVPYFLKHHYHDDYSV